MERQRRLKHRRKILCPTGWRALANTDSYSHSYPNSHIYSHANRYLHAYSHSHVYSDTDRHIHAYSHSYIYADTYTDSNSDTDPNAYSYTDANPNTSLTSTFHLTESKFSHSWHVFSAARQKCRLHRSNSERLGRAFGRD